MLQTETGGARTGGPFILQQRRPYPTETEPVPGENPSESRQRPQSPDKPYSTPDSTLPDERGRGSSVETDVPARREGDPPDFVG